MVQLPTSPGRHIASHTPMRLSGAVPATMKSFAVSMAPMLSVPARYTLPSASSPAITGDTKYGPNLRHAIGTVLHINDRGLS